MKYRILFHFLSAGIGWLLAPVLLSFLLFACSTVTQSGNEILPSVTSTLSVNTRTLTPKPKKSPELTVTPTQYPLRTPTFDAKTSVTLTPASSAQCPTISSSLVPDITAWYSTEGLRALQAQPALDFLNSGGNPEMVVNALVQKYGSRIPLPATQQDITGDGVSELLITDDNQVMVFGCDHGKFQLLLQVSWGESFTRYIRFVIPGDMNLNGIPEVIIDEQSGHMNFTHSVTIYEWDGHQLTSILQGDQYAEGKYFKTAYMDGVTTINVQDVDGNQTLELILNGSEPLHETNDYTAGFPWRKETHIFSWNGKLFTLYRVEFSPPDYRFQAVQDGDRASLIGEYSRALELYQDAIFSDNLDWWSDDLWSYEVRRLSIIETPDPTPIPDSSEYPNLAAYAYYRILLLQAVNGYLPEAEATLKTMTEKFSKDDAGYAYTELAIIFWNEFQMSSNVQQACSKAIEYANLHPMEILSYLGNGDYARTYFGYQSFMYTSKDTCPFR